MNLAKSKMEENKEIIEIDKQNDESMKETLLLLNSLVKSSKIANHKPTFLDKTITIKSEFVTLIFLYHVQSIY